MGRVNAISNRISASQIMYFVVLAFLCFNCYRLGYALGISHHNWNVTGANVSAYALKVIHWR